MEEAGNKAKDSSWMLEYLCGIVDRQCLAGHHWKMGKLHMLDADYGIVSSNCKQGILFANIHMDGSEQWCAKWKNSIIYNKI